MGEESQRGMSGWIEGLMGKMSINKRQPTVCCLVFTTAVTKRSPNLPNYRKVLWVCIISILRTCHEQAWQRGEAHKNKFKSWLFQMNGTELKLTMRCGYQSSVSWRRAPHQLSCGAHLGPRCCPVQCPWSAGEPHQPANAATQAGQHAGRAEGAVTHRHTLAWTVNQIQRCEVMKANVELNQCCLSLPAAQH